MKPEQYRQKILQTLYEKDAKDSLHKLDNEVLAQKLELPWDEIRQEVIYLNQKGYVVLKIRQIRTRIFHTLYLTAKGVDFVEKGYSDEMDTIRRNLVQRYSNLQYLEEQAATYGTGQVPLHLHNQIKLERQAIRDLEDVLEK